jgi:hypothetical protein
MEAQSMINSKNSAAATEDVTTLAISIVDQHIENGEQPEISNVGVDHRHGTIIAVETFH